MEVDVHRHKNSRAWLKKLIKAKVWSIKIIKDYRFNVVWCDPLLLPLIRKCDSFLKYYHYPLQLLQCSPLYAHIIQLFWLDWNHAMFKTKDRRKLRQQA